MNRSLSSVAILCLFFMAIGILVVVVKADPSSTPPRKDTFVSSPSPNAVQTVQIDGYVLRSGFVSEYDSIFVEEATPLASRLRCHASARVSATY